MQTNLLLDLIGFSDFLSVCIQSPTDLICFSTFPQRVYNFILTKISFSRPKTHKISRAVTPRASSAGAKMPQQSPPRVYFRLFHTLACILSTKIPLNVPPFPPSLARFAPQKRPSPYGLDLFIIFISPLHRDESMLCEVHTPHV